MRREKPFAGKQWKLEATHLRGRRWAVRPAGQLGTCGFVPTPWKVAYVTARTAEEAIRKAWKES